MVNYYLGKAKKLFLSIGIPELIADYFTEIVRKICYGGVDLNYEIAKPYIPDRFM